MATPPPIPVEPSSSRLPSSANSRSGSTSTIAPAWRASADSSFFLSAAATSVMTLSAERKSEIFMGRGAFEAGEAAVDRDADESIGRAQPVTYTSFGENVLRPFWIGFDLLPELPHIDP